MPVGRPRIQKVFLYKKGPFLDDNHFHLIPYMVQMLQLMRKKKLFK